VRLQELASGGGDLQRTLAWAPANQRLRQEGVADGFAQRPGQMVAPLAPVQARLAGRQ